MRYCAHERMRVCAKCNWSFAALARKFLEDYVSILHHLKNMENNDNASYLIIEEQTMLAIWNPVLGGK